MSLFFIFPKKTPNAFWVTSHNSHSPSGWWLPWELREGVRGSVLCLTIQTGLGKKAFIVANELLTLLDFLLMKSIAPC